MIRFIKGAAVGAILIGAVLVVDPRHLGHPAAVFIAIAWLPLCLLAARRDRRQQARKDERRKARQQPSGYAGWTR